MSTGIGSLSVCSGAMPIDVGSPPAYIGPRSIDIGPPWVGNGSMFTDTRLMPACSGPASACSVTTPTDREPLSAYTGPVSTDSGSTSAYGVTTSTDAGSMSSRRVAMSTDLGSMPACSVTKSTDLRSLSADLGPMSTDLRSLSACTGPMPAEIKPMPARGGSIYLHAGPRYLTSARCRLAISCYQLAAFQVPGRQLLVAWQWSAVSLRSFRSPRPPSSSARPRKRPRRKWTRGGGPEARTWPLGWGLSRTRSLQLTTSPISGQEGRNRPLRFWGGVRKGGCDRSPPDAPEEEPRACLFVKPVREPEAGDPHVRFDERRRETEPGSRLRHRHFRQKPPATATPSTYRPLNAGPE